jgi:hypothetical protein
VHMNHVCAAATAQQDSRSSSVLLCLTVTVSTLNFSNLFEFPFGT